MNLGPARLCRMDDALVGDIAGSRDLRRLGGAVSVALVAAAAIYGAAFGAWRSPEQALVSAVKMPAMLFGVVALSSLINVLLCHVLGGGLSARQVGVAILLSLAVTAVLLAAWSPVILFLTLQAPPPESARAESAYRSILVLHTAVVGACGLAGTVRMHGLLRRLTGSAATARRLVAAWVLTSGLTGCELSWVLSPFLAKPGQPVPLVNPDAFRGNFFEYLGSALERMT